MLILSGWQGVVVAPLVEVSWLERGRSLAGGALGVTKQVVEREWHLRTGTLRVCMMSVALGVQGKGLR